MRRERDQARRAQAEALLAGWGLWGHVQGSPEKAPLQVISSSKRSEKPSPVLSFSSRPSMNWGWGKRSVRLRAATNTSE